MLKLGNTYLNFGGTYLKDWTAMINPSFSETRIVNQTWMSENLNIDDGEGGIYTKTVSFNQWPAHTEYYYTLEAAKRISNKIVGWHLPSKAEYETLISNIKTDAVGTVTNETVGRTLKSEWGWKSNPGTIIAYYPDCRMYPVGIYDNAYFTPTSGFDAETEEAMFWTSTSSGENRSYYFELSYLDYDPFMWTMPNYEACSIRLIKD